jgi:hypothetical protein
VQANNSSVVADTSGSVHIVWGDKRAGGFEIYYRTFDGFAWGPEERLTYALGTSRHPSMAMDDAGRQHVVWSDDRDGPYEIYYKSRDPGVLSGIAERPGEDLPGAEGSCLGVGFLPNPVSGAADIWFRSPPAAEVALSIYDTAGRLVWTHRLEAAARLSRVTWDAKDHSGDRVAPGVYFLKLKAGKQTASAKVVVLR